MKGRHGKKSEKESCEKKRDLGTMWSLHFFKRLADIPSQGGIKVQGLVPKKSLVTSIKGKKHNYLACYEEERLGNKISVQKII
jgi:hypothetical protein